MLHDVVKSIISDSRYAVNIHHLSLSCKAESINAVDVDGVKSAVLLKRNFRTLTTKLLKSAYLFHIVRALIEVSDIEG